MLIFTFAPLHLCHPRSSFPLLFCPPFPLPSRILCLLSAIHQWLLFFNKCRRSGARWGKEDGCRANAERPFIFLPLYRLPHVSILPLLPSLYLPPPHTHTHTLCLCLRRLLQELGCMHNGPALLRFAYSGLC